MDRRIDLIRQGLETKTTPLSDTPKQSHKKRKFLLTKTSEISKSLLSQDQQGQHIEIVDSDEDNEEIEIEDDDEYIERNCKNDEAPANISTRTRNSKKK